MIPPVLCAARSWTGWEKTLWLECAEDRVLRHNAIRNVVFEAAEGLARVSSELEKPGLFPPRSPGSGDPAARAGSDQHRPADFIVPRGP